MTIVTRIVTEEEQPANPNREPRYWGQEHDPDLVLVIFDTAVIDKINNEQYSEPVMEEFRWKKPLGKYAVSFETGFTDSGIFGQVMLTHDKYRDAAVWFNTFSDLPFAIKALRERYPDVQIPEQVSYVVDWPVRRRDNTPGATVVITGSQANESAA